MKVRNKSFFFIFSIIFLIIFTPVAFAWEPDQGSFPAGQSGTDPQNQTNSFTNGLLGSGYYDSETSGVGSPYYGFYGGGTVGWNAYIPDAYGYGTTYIDVYPFATARIAPTTSGVVTSGSTTSFARPSGTVSQLAYTISPTTWSIETNYDLSHVYLMECDAYSEDPGGGCERVYDEYNYGHEEYLNDGVFYSSDNWEDVKTETLAIGALAYGKCCWTGWSTHSYADIGLFDFVAMPCDKDWIVDKITIEWGICDIKRTVGSLPDYRAFARSHEAQAHLHLQTKYGDEELNYKYVHDNNPDDTAPIRPYEFFDTPYEDTWNYDGNNLRFYKLTTEYIGDGTDTIGSLCYMMDMGFPVFKFWLHSEGWTNRVGLHSSAWLGLTEFNVKYTFRWNPATSDFATTQTMANHLIQAKGYGSTWHNPNMVSGVISFDHSYASQIAGSLEVRSTVYADFSATVSFNVARVGFYTNSGTGDLTLQFSPNKGSSWISLSPSGGKWRIQSPSNLKSASYYTAGEGLNLYFRPYAYASGVYGFIFNYIITYSSINYLKTGSTSNYIGSQSFSISAGRYIDEHWTDAVFYYAPYISHATLGGSDLTSLDITTYLDYDADGTPTYHFRDADSVDFNWDGQSAGSVSLSWECDSTKPFIYDTAQPSTGIEFEPVFFEVGSSDTTAPIRESWLMLREVGEEATPTALPYRETIGGYAYFSDEFTMPYGEYEYWYLVRDFAGNWRTSTLYTLTLAITTVDIDVIQVDSYMEGETGNYLKFSLDSHGGLGDTYEVFIDGNSVDSGDWDYDNYFVEINIDGYSAGTHDISIYADNIYGRYSYEYPQFTVSQSSVDINVIQVDSYMEGETGNLLIFEISGDYPDFYEVYIDSILVDNGDWEYSGYLVEGYIDGYSAGIYDITIYAENDYGRFEYEYPQFEVTPSSVDIDVIQVDSYMEGEVNNYLKFMIYGLSGDFYEVYIDSELKFSGNWNLDGYLVEELIDGYPEGIYDIEIYAENTYGRFEYEYAQFEVEAGSTNITLLQLDSYLEGETENYLAFNLSGLSGEVYEVYINDSLEFSGTWNYDGFVVTESLDGYTEGVYKVFIFANNTYGREDNLTAWFSIAPSTVELTLLQLDSYREGETENYLAFDISGLFGYALDGEVYEVYINDILTFSGTWFYNNYLVNESLDGYTEGLYEVFIFCNNTYGKEDNLTTWFSIAPSTVELTLLQLDSYIEGETENYLAFDISGLFGYAYDGDSYEVYIDNILTFSGTWFYNNYLVNESLDGYIEGVHTIYIYANNTYGKEDSYFTYFTIAPSYVQIILLELNENYEYGSIGNRLIFNISSTTGDLYEINIDGTLLFTGLWSGGIHNVNVSVDGFPIGFHNIKIFANNSFGKESNLTLEFIVSIRPIFTLVPEIYREKGECTGTYTMTWKVIDDNPKNYSIYHNDDLATSGFWVSGEDISFTVDTFNLTQGFTHTFKIILDDGHRNSIMNETQLYVFPVIPLVSDEQGGGLYEDEIVDTYWEVYDQYLQSYRIDYFDPLFGWSLYSQGELNPMPMLQNVIVYFDGNNFSVGDYIIRFSVSDKNGNTASDDINVTVLPHPPIVSDALDGYYYSDDKHAELVWTVSDANLLRYWIEIETDVGYEIIQNGTLTNYTQTEINLDLYHLLLPTGKHNITLYVEDTYGNIVSDAVNVNNKGEEAGVELNTTGLTTWIMTFLIAGCSLYFVTKTDYWERADDKDKYKIYIAVGGITTAILIIISIFGMFPVTFTKLDEVVAVMESSLGGYGLLILILGVAGGSIGGFFGVRYLLQRRKGGV